MISALDRERIEEVHRIITLPDPPQWDGSIVNRVNDLCDHSLSSAIERGKWLDFWLRSQGMRLSQESLDAAGFHVPVRLARKFLDLSTHKSRCEQAPGYLDQRRYGTRQGEQEIVDHIRRLDIEGHSFRAIAEKLNRCGMLPRKGHWNPKTISFVIRNAEQGRPHQPCTCRMFRLDWAKPEQWRVCWEVLFLPDRVFEAMVQGGFLHRDTTKNNLNNFKKSRVFRPSYALSPKENQQQKGTFVNEVVHGDCFDLIPRLADNSVFAVITSPPYTQQRDQYECIPPALYPERMIALMMALWPKLREDGSVLMVIRSHVVDGCISDYVSRTVLAIRDAGWLQPGEIIWYKPDGWPLGAVNRPRRNWEHVLWFAKSKRPFVDLKACGQPSRRLGLGGGNRHGIVKGITPPGDGIARCTDVITACAGKVDKGIDHPAVFPYDLVRQLIRTYAPPGSLILDPFAGSGTTCLVAQSEDYDFIGFDNGTSSGGELYAHMATRRLQSESKYARGKAKRDRETKE